MKADVNEGCNFFFKNELLHCFEGKWSKPVSISTDDGFFHDRNCFYQENSGAFWFSTSKGLLRKSSSSSTLFDRNDLAAFASIDNLTFDSKGTVWCAASATVIRLTPENQVCNNYITKFDRKNIDIYRTESKMFNVRGFPANWKNCNRFDLNGRKLSSSMEMHDIAKGMYILQMNILPVQLKRN